LGRQQQIAVLVEHYQNPRHRGALEDVDVVMPGGSPECGGSVVIYLKAGEEGRMDALSFTGEGDIISQASTSMILEQVTNDGLTMDEVLALDYDAFVDRVGREAVARATPPWASARSSRPSGNTRETGSTPGSLSPASPLVVAPDRSPPPGCSLPGLRTGIGLPDSRSRPGAV